MRSIIRFNPHVARKESTCHALLLLLLLHDLYSANFEDRVRGVYDRMYSASQRLLRGVTISITREFWIKTLNIVLKVRLKSCHQNLVISRVKAWFLSWYGLVFIIVTDDLVITLVLVVLDAILIFASKVLSLSCHCHWVTLCFAKTKVLKSGLKPKLNLDTKIHFQTNAQFDFGFKPKFRFETEF